ncbi:MAG: hypothetical protein OTI35_03570 [Sulfitobacter sp.]|nr:hypothetical protein [Sulfitobacter sp.]
MTDTGGRYPGWKPGIELRDDWLSLVQEAIIDPVREIVDPHHHLWRHGTDENPAVYEMDALWRDTGSGHNVVQTMFIECRSYWDLDAPAHLQSVAETREVTQMAATAGKGHAKIAGIIGQTELVLDPALLHEALDAHTDAGQGLSKVFATPVRAIRSPPVLPYRGAVFRTNTVILTSDAARRFWANAALRWTVGIITTSIRNFLIWPARFRAQR